MTNILLRYTNHFGRYPKNTLINKCKKITNFKIQCHDTAFILNMQEIPQDETKRNIFVQKFTNISRRIQNHEPVQETEIASVIDLLPSEQVIKAKHVNSLITWCNEITNSLPLERVKLAQSLWVALTLCNFRFSLKHYNTLLDLYINNEYDDFSLVDLLNQMTYRRIQPNLHTYALCIKYCCMKGDISTGLMYLEPFIRRMQHQSEFIFDGLIMAYSQFGDIEKVNEILGIMERRSIQLTSNTYFHVMCTYAKLNNIDKIEEIIRDCSLKNIYFTNSNIINVIYVLAKNGHISNIDKMYQYLHKKKNVWKKETDVILKLIDINQNQIAMNVLSHMLSNSNCLEFENALKIILKYMVTKSVIINDIVNICTFLKDEQIFKKSLLISLHYSLMYNNRLSLSLLRICKSHSKIKPHYFWPLLVKCVNKYDLQGILDLLRIMINEFNISPCVNTLVNYVLPLSFGKTIKMRNMLINHKISVTVIDNAYVLWKLKTLNIKSACNYVNKFQGKYFYNILGNELTRASLITNDTQTFIYISNLLGDVDLRSTISMLKMELNQSEFVSINAGLDRQLRNFMIDYPSHKIWLRKVVEELVLNNISLHYETVKLIHEFLNVYVTRNIHTLLYKLSNKTYKYLSR